MYTEADVVSGSGTVLLVEDKERAFDITQGGILERLGSRVRLLYFLESFFGNLCLARLRVFSNDTLEQYL